MKFKEAKNNYYKSIQEILEEDIPRNKLWNKNAFIIKKLQQDLFDDFDVEKVNLIGDFINKEVLYTDRIDLLIEVEKGSFEELVDNKFMEDYDLSDLKIYSTVKDNMYVFDGKTWREGGSLCENLILLGDLSFDKEKDIQDFSSGRRKLRN